MFDIYSLKARVYPMVIVLIPLVVLGIFYSFEFNSVIHSLASLGLVGVLTYLFSQLGRDAGKRKEPALWKKWGGSPSVQLLRWRNSAIDVHTKKRYHEKLMIANTVSFTPSPGEEQANPDAADQVYQSWCKFLIGQTRDTKKFNLLFKDNVSYGFRRNLWGLKPIALWLLSILALSNYLYWFIALGNYRPTVFPVGWFYSEGVLLALMLFWLWAITTRWVRIPAEAYAERLLESIDQLNKE